MDNWQKKIIALYPGMMGVYRNAFNDPNLELQLFEDGITNTPKRLAAFLATCVIESGYFKNVRENMNYSAAQIMKVFGVGKHSAAVTKAEAAKLARNPAALAERVYGLGNPRKANELGNTKPGDAFMYRGLGPFQHTGKALIEREIRRANITTLVELLQPEHIFQPAINYWSDRHMNFTADDGDIRAIRKMVNGGYNGYAEFKKEYERILEILLDGDAVEKPVLPGVREMQKNLIALGYNIEADGIYGDETEAAVRAFQEANPPLIPDGIFGNMTAETMRTRLRASAPVNPPKIPLMTDSSKTATGAGSIGLGAAAEVILDSARSISGMGLESPVLQAIPPVLMVVGLGFMIWPLVKGKKDA